MSNIDTKTGPEILREISFWRVAQKANTTYQTVSKFSKGEKATHLSKQEAIINAAIQVRSEQIEEYVKEIEILQSWAKELQF